MKATTLIALFLRGGGGKNWLADLERGWRGCVEIRKLKRVD